MRLRVSGPPRVTRKGVSHLSDQHVPVTVTGAVLAGGLSRRMGQDKASLMLGGESLLARAVRLLEASVGDVVVVGPPDRHALVPRVRVVSDVFPGLGPLGGIYSALQATRTEYIVVAACDMPFIRPAFINYLIGLAPGYDLVVPRSEHGTEQLCAVYGRVCLPIAARCLRDGTLAVATLMAHARARIVEPDEWSPHDPGGWSLVNANTPEDWRRITSHFAELAGEGCG